MMIQCLVSSVAMSYLGIRQDLMVSSGAQNAAVQRCVLWGLVMSLSEGVFVFCGC